MSIEYITEDEEGKINIWNTLQSNSSHLPIKILRFCYDDYVNYGANLRKDWLYKHQKMLWQLKETNNLYLQF